MSGSGRERSGLRLDAVGTGLARHAMLVEPAGHGFLTGAVFPDDPEALEHSIAVAASGQEIIGCPRIAPGQHQRLSGDADIRYALPGRLGNIVGKGQAADLQ